MNTEQISKPSANSEGSKLSKPISMGELATDGHGNEYRALYFRSDR